MYCSNCGKKVNDNVKFCSYCGADVKTGVIPTRAKPVGPTPTMAPTYGAPSKKKSKGVIAIVIICIIVAAGSLVALFAFLTYGSIDETEYYYYNPTTASSIEQISIDTDVGSIRIKYIDDVNAPVAKIQVHYQIAGLFHSGKALSDVCEATWDNLSEVTKLSINRIPNFWIWPFSFYNTSITMTLREDIVYEINATAVTGGVEMIIPNGVSVEDIRLATTTGGVTLIADKDSLFKGDLLVHTITGGVGIYANGANFTKDITSGTVTGGLTLNFTNCGFKGNIVGTVTTGGIHLKTFNAEYIQNSLWTLSSTTGGIDMEIYQYSPMSANVTGQISVTTGGIDVIYEDNETSVGAKFTGSTTTGGIDYVNNGGFDVTGDLFESNDYETANQKYLFNMATVTGGIDVAGKSA